jgi:hypothetical protein
METDFGLLKSQKYDFIAATGCFVYNVWSMGIISLFGV